MFDLFIHWYLLQNLNEIDKVSIATCFFFNIMEYFYMDIDLMIDILVIYNLQWYPHSLYGKDIHHQYQDAYICSFSREIWLSFKLKVMTRLSWVWSLFFTTTSL